MSQQTAPNSRKSQVDNKLSFPILNDKGGETAAAFGIRFRLPDDLMELYKRLKVDLSVINGEPSWTLPMPARYVIGQDGVIAYAEINPDYTRRPEPDELLPVLERLLKQAA
jgi:peroxiredoxin